MDDFNHSANRSSCIFVVCMEIKTITKAEGSYVRWTLGSCSSAIEYEDFTTYLERCCILEGHYTLTCINTERSAGWNQGYIEIHGHTFCNDFWTYRSMQQIQVKGEKMFIVSSYVEIPSLLVQIYNLYIFTESFIKTLDESIASAADTPQSGK